MKNTLIRILVLLLLVAMLVSCETLWTDCTDSPKQQQDNEARFMGTWVYSDKNFGETAKSLGIKGWPSDSKFELTFSFRSDGTGIFTKTTSSGGRENKEQQEFLWSLDSIFPKRVLVVVRDNTATNFNLYYESAFFLSMNDADLGEMYFAKQQQGMTEQEALAPNR